VQLVRAINVELCRRRCCSFCPSARTRSPVASVETWKRFTCGTLRGLNRRRIDGVFRRRACRPARLRKAARRDKRRSQQTSARIFVASDRYPEYFQTSSSRRPNRLAFGIVNDSPHLTSLPRIYDSIGTLRAPLVALKSITSDTRTSRVNWMAAKGSSRGCRRRWRSRMEPQPRRQLS
jgi:hypothetical protein